MNALDAMRFFFFFTARIRRMGGGNIFSLFTSGGGGVPVSHNALQHFPECHGAAGGGYPARSSWRGGYPGRGGTLAGGGGYPIRTTQGVLATLRAVCLLRSRRRTFLFFLQMVYNLQLLAAFLFVDLLSVVLTETGFFTTLGNSF